MKMYDVEVCPSTHLCSTIKNLNKSRPGFEIVSVHQESLDGRLYYRIIFTYIEEENKNDTSKN